MINKIKEKGITLIALVVTIVILLILAGVTISMTIAQNGLFSRAQNAADRYKKAQEDEADLISQIGKEMYSEYIGAKVTGYNPVTRTADNPCTIGTITSGHDTAQTFTTDTVETTETGMKWRVWDFDGSILRIIGDPTTQTLTLSKVAGYNNGVWAINEICKECYSNGKKGVTVTSLKRSDIQKVSSYDYTKYKHKQNGDVAWKEVTGNSDDTDLIYFGETKTYSNGNTKYPKMWGDNDQNWTYVYDKNTKIGSGEDKECTIWESIGNGEGQIKEEMTSGTANTTFKQSYYAHTYKEEDFPNKKYYDLIFKKADGKTRAGDYWLATRCMILYENYCGFGVQIVSCGESLVYGSLLCYSHDYINSRDRKIRPMVSIDLKSSGCTVTPQYRRRWKRYIT